MVALHRAVALRPGDATAQTALGQAYLGQGKFALALRHYQRGVERDHAGARRGIAEVQRLADLDAKLSAILKGKSKPRDAEEMLALADLCRRFRRRYDLAARFYAEAFRKRVDLEEDLGKGHRAGAAAVAALAGCGGGDKADVLSAKERFVWASKRWPGCGPSSALHHLAGGHTGAYAGTERRARTAGGGRLRLRARSAEVGPSVRRGAHRLAEGVGGRDGVARTGRQVRWKKKMNHRDTEDTEKRKQEERGAGGDYAPLFPPSCLSVFVFSVSSVPLWFIFFFRSPKPQVEEVDCVPNDRFATFLD